MDAKAIMDTITEAIKQLSLEWGNEGYWQSLAMHVFTVLESAKKGICQFCGLPIHDVKRLFYLRVHDSPHALSGSSFCSDRCQANYEDYLPRVFEHPPTYLTNGVPFKFSGRKPNEPAEEDLTCGQCKKVSRTKVCKVYYLDEREYDHNTFCKNNACFNIYIVRKNFPRWKDGKTPQYNTGFSTSKRVIHSCHLSCCAIHHS
jgi:hypothetical protein